MTLEQIYNEADVAAKKAYADGFAKYIARGETKELAEAWATEDAGDAYDAVCRHMNV